MKVKLLINIGIMCSTLSAWALNEPEIFVDSNPYVPLPFAASGVGKHGWFSRVICDSEVDVCRAIGFYYLLSGSGSSPMLALSADSGKHWTYPIRSGSNLPKNSCYSFFTDIDCKGNTCIIVGNYWDSVIGTEVPLIAKSTDGGLTWSYPMESGAHLPANFSSYGNFAKLSCNSNGNICVAGGAYNDNDGIQVPMLALSADAGSTWTYSIESGSHLPADYKENGYFTRVSCNSEGDICVAVGKSYSTSTGSLFPLLAVSRDGGNTWTYPLTSLPRDFNSNLDFKDLTCNSAGDTCIAVGSYWTHKSEVPLIAITNDAGSTWSYSSELNSNLPSDLSSVYGWNQKSFKSVSCSSEGDVCIAVGSYLNQDQYIGAPEIPMISLSTDHGRTWTYPIQSGSNFPEDLIFSANGSGGTFAHVSCNSSGKICSAVGRYMEKFTAPMLALTTDAGKTWTYPITTAHLPADFVSHVVASSFYGVNCNTKGNVCSAVGSYETYARDIGPIPMLALSTDGGSTWTYPIDSQSYSVYSVESVDLAPDK